MFNWSPQEGSGEEGAALSENTHYSVYANTFYNEVFVPWNATLPNKLQATVKSSYKTGDANNWYRIRIVGYVLAN